MFFAHEIHIYTSVESVFKSGFSVDKLEFRIYAVIERGGFTGVGLGAAEPRRRGPPECAFCKIVSRFVLTFNRLSNRNVSGKYRNRAHNIIIDTPL